MRALSSVGSERLVYTEEVGGSSPSVPTICRGSSVVEHGSEKPGVDSSILSPGTIAGSSNGRTVAFEAINLGSNPSPAAKIFPDTTVYIQWFVDKPDSST